MAVHVDGSSLDSRAATLGRDWAMSPLMNSFDCNSIGATLTHCRGVAGDRRRPRRFGELPRPKSGTSSFYPGISLITKSARYHDYKHLARALVPQSVPPEPWHFGAMQEFFYSFPLHGIHSTSVSVV